MNVLTYGEWRDTCDTVHMLLQMMGKAKLQSMDPQPEWKQVVLDADANGFTTGLIPFGADGFEIKLNIADAEMAAMTAAGDCARFSIEEGVSVSVRPFHGDARKHRASDSHQHRPAGNAH